MQPDFSTLKPVASSSQPDFSTLKPAAALQQEASPNATFQSQGNESIGSGVMKLLGNIPSSAINFGVNTVKALNPIQIVKTASQIPSEFSHLVQESGGVKNALVGGAKEFLPSAYGALVPKATQQVISGDFQGARATLQNDPIGQVLPYLLVGKAAAEKAGVGAQFDSTVSKMAAPVTDTVSATASKAGGLVGKVGSQILGAATGAGASSIEEAAKHTQAFTDALRGKINPDDIVQNVQDAVRNVAEQRRNTYVGQLSKIGEEKGSLDISPVINQVGTQLKNFGVRVSDDGSLDFSRSSIANNGSARADIQGVYNTLKDWGTQPGDRTPLGLDTLKKQLGDFYSDSGSARAFVQGVKSSVKDILDNQVDGYIEMTKGYSEASKFLDDIKSATGVGGKAKVDTVFTKLTSALKQDKQLRLDVLNEIQAKGAQPDIMAKLAGMNMQSFIPKGIIGRGIDAYATLSHFFSPAIIPTLLATSPRVVGEFVRSLGLGAEKTTAILQAINHLPENTRVQIGASNNATLTSGGAKVVSPIQSRTMEIKK